MIEHPATEIKAMAWKGETPPPLMPYEEMHYICMQLLSLVLAYQKASENEAKAQALKSVALKATKLFEQCQLTERIADENLRRYRMLYDKIRGSVKPKCPTCDEILLTLSGVNDLKDFWKEGEETIEV
ncbi:MAG TPA: hypothetical protein DCO72_00905 [Ruminococcus sp.]|nr:hypothetical protein [Ruminococcus sp.]